MHSKSNTGSSKVSSSKEKSYGAVSPRQWKTLLASYESGALSDVAISFVTGLRYEVTKELISSELRNKAALSLPISLRNRDSDIVDLYVNYGLSALRIAKLYGCPHEAIRRVLRKNKIPLRTKSQAQALFSQRTLSSFLQRHSSEIEELNESAITIA